MAKPELGTKRICLTCAAKFYDLNRNPIACPKCGTPFQLAQLARAARPEEDEDADGIAPAGAEFVPLDAVDGDDAAKALPDDDIELEDDAIGDDDDTFLATEEDEDDDDVADLIDGDLEEDEES